MSPAGDPVDELLPQLTARLDAAAEAGLRGDDPGAVVLVRRLLERARDGRGAARERLLRLAEARLADAEARAAEVARRLADALAPLGAEAASHREALARGETLSVARAIRRAKRGGPRLLGRAPSRAVEVTSGGTVVAPRPSTTPRPSPMHRYRAAAAEAEAELALSRSKRSLPELAGLYHGGVAADEALHTMERAGRGYLVAQLSRFEAYAAVHSLLEAFEPPKARKAKKRSKR